MQWIRHRRYFAVGRDKQMPLPRFDPRFLHAKGIEISRLVQPAADGAAQKPKKTESSRVPGDVEAEISRLQRAPAAEIKTGESIGIVPDEEKRCPPRKFGSSGQSVGEIVR
jgi:hypothetical protein